MNRQFAINHLRLAKHLLLAISYEAAIIRSSYITNLLLIVHRQWCIANVLLMAHSKLLIHGRGCKSL